MEMRTITVQLNLKNCECDGYQNSRIIAKEKWGTYLSSTGKKIWVVYSEDEFLVFTAGMKDESLADTWYLDSLHITEKARGDLQI